MFENLRAAVKKEHENRKAEAAFYILHGYCTTWAADHQKESDEGIKRHSTATRWTAYQAGKITREKAVELATARRVKELEKEYAAQVARIDAAEAAPDVQSIAIHIEWKRSATWGKNPHASVIVNHANRYTGSASGCGYDKRTTAIANAAGQSATLQKMIFALKESALQTGDFTPHAVGECYGMPYFAAGVGMSSYRELFRRCGLTAEVDNESGKNFDTYYFTREAK